MKTLRLLSIVCTCLVGMAPFAAAQYTSPSAPHQGFNYATCYAPSAGTWVPLANTAANIAAFPTTCDGQGNLLTFAPSVTVTTAAPGNVRTIIGSITTSNASYSNGSSNLAGVSGLVTIPSGTTAAAGYIYGTQGKFVLGGTVSGSIWGAGVQGQIDISAATLTSASHVTPIWSDAGATGPSVTCTFCDSLVLTNTTATTFNSLIYGYSKAGYFADLSNNGSGYIIGGSGASAAVTGYLKIKINGVDAFIRYYASAT